MLTLEHEISKKLTKSVTRILGLDLGQAKDHSAGILLERNRYPAGWPGEKDERLRARLIQRWPLGTEYTTLAAEVAEIPVNYLLVDFGGVGRPVVEMIRREAQQRNFAGRIIPVALIGSSAQGSLVRSNTGQQHYNVPKVEVLTSILVVQQQKRLSLPNVPETRLLIEEMRNFRLKITKAANMTMDAALGQHDDLVIALGLGCWWALRERKAAFLW